MAICYDRLFHLMIDKKMSNAQLKEKAGLTRLHLFLEKNVLWICRTCKGGEP